MTCGKPGNLRIYKGLFVPRCVGTSLGQTWDKTAKPNSQNNLPVPRFWGRVGTNAKITWSLTPSVFADGFDRAGHECLFAAGDLFGGFGLFKDVEVAVLVIAAEVGWRGIAAHIAVNALPVDEEFARGVFR